MPRYPCRALLLAGRLGQAQGANVAGAGLLRLQIQQPLPVR